MHTYLVTFTNASYVAAAEEPANVVITVVCDVEPVDVADDADVADVIVRYAIVVWRTSQDTPPVDWTLDEPGWEAALLTLPDGEVLDLG